MHFEVWVIKLYEFLKIIYHTRKVGVLIFCQYPMFLIKKNLNNIKYIGEKILENYNIQEYILGKIVIYTIDLLIE